MLSQNRRQFLKNLGVFSASAVYSSFLTGCSQLVSKSLEKENPPNIILVLTDDQGFGDLGCHGNKEVKTPNIDKFAQESVELFQFYVNPLCAPTRASLMTGRYCYRTRVVDTFAGRAMMDPKEVTIAEVLKNAGYKTAIFGKWHLGDNYPMRPMEQGFDESIVHRGGGIGQPGDPPGGSDYFDPILFHNGKQKKYKGYCMDVYTDKAIEFIQNNKDKPFFVYLSTNTVHVPLIISEKYTAPYKAMGLTENTSKVYGMVTNIDDNFARLLKKLKQLGLEENTIVIFMTDNGPCNKCIEKDRYIAGLRGMKITPYENGIRVPCFIRWPKKFEGNRKINTISAHIDIMPTLLDACHLKKPANFKFDGLSLMPLLENKKTKWPNRTLFFQYHRTNTPQLYHYFAARNQKYKLLNSKGINKNQEELNLELYDISKDPYEKNDIADQHPKIVEKMKNDYEKWFKDVANTRGFDPPKIHLGTIYENPVILTRQQWRRIQDYTDECPGHWDVKVVHKGRYNLSLTLKNPADNNGTVHFKFTNISLTKHLKKDNQKIAFKNIFLPKASGRLKIWARANQKAIWPEYLEIDKIK